ncbi:hypothetical protein [Shewanella sp. Isolate7]|uniref:hypothetical protein n=1 Tax=Shewanella sp. Isolate7 TaxID=2908528 RepID=UPI001EFD04EC|nr:hypothetical protein [Shewanella sp. Isolate7]MCG9721347.1 hypothetical protein [Shewanella sp. Isolate7]
MQVSPAMAYQQLNQPVNQPAYQQVKRQDDNAAIMPPAGKMMPHQGSQTAETKVDGVQDTVSISAQARLLSEHDKASAQATATQQLNRPVPDDALDKLKDYKKAQLEYQVRSDMASIVTGNHNGLSPVSIYYLSRHDDARSAVVNASMQQQQVSAMQTYAKSNEQAMSWYQA